MTTPISTHCRCSQQHLVAACRPGCFKKSARIWGLCYSIFSFSSLHNDGGMLGIYAGTGVSEVPALMTAIGQELAGLGQAMTDAELNRAKVQMKAGLLMSLEGCFSTCEDMARPASVLWPQAVCRRNQRTH